MLVKAAVSDLCGEQHQQGLLRQLEMTSVEASTYNACSCNYR
jgi:hypothetical protein